jgi:hypothetical protein
LLLRSIKDESGGTGMPRPAPLSLLALLAVTATLGGCVRHHHRLHYTPALQDRDAHSTAHLTPEAPVTSLLGVSNLLLGPGAEEVEADLIEIETEQLDALFADEPPPDAEYRYRFVHFADLQLRDRATGLGLGVERAVDRHVRFMRNNYYQDHADVLYAAFMFRAMRHLIDSGSHRFVVHAGDALHINTRDELEAYTALTERFLLADPDRGAPCRDCWTEAGWLTPLSRSAVQAEPSHLYFNTIGNHEVLRWGSFRTGDGTLLRPRPQDIGTIEEFAGHVADLGGGDAALVGGDLVSAGPADHASYYALDLDVADGHRARVVVLDVFRDCRRGRAGVRSSSPAIDAEQRTWLSTTLGEAQADPTIDHVLVVGHAPLWRIASPGEKPRDTHPNELEGVLAGHDKVIAWLSGHFHSGIPPRSKRLRDKDYPFAHLSLPSMMEFPKVFSSVTVTARTDGSYVLQAEPYTLEDLDIVGGRFRAGETSVDVSVDVERTQQQAFVDWLDALHAVCGDDARCRAEQAALDCWAGARQDRPEYVESWYDGKRDQFAVELTVDRAP